MSDDTLHDTAPKATKALFGTLGFILIMVGIELMTEREGPRYALGLPLLTAGATCFYAVVAWAAIRERLPEAAKSTIATIARSPQWWFGTILVALLVAALSPYVQEGRWPFVSWFVTPPPAASMANPLHEPAAKWRLADGLSILARDKRVGKCKVYFNRYQSSYAETFYDDLKSVLTTVDWEYSEKFATGELPRGLSVTKLSGLPPYNCAENFAGALMNAASPGVLTVSATNIDMGAAPDYLRQCQNCIVLNIGNPPDR
jgi:hypothetical protein